MSPSLSKDSRFSSQHLLSSCPSNSALTPSRTSTASSTTSLSTSLFSASSSCSSLASSEYSCDSSDENNKETLTQSNSNYNNIQQQTTASALKPFVSSPDGLFYSSSSGHRSIPKTQQPSCTEDMQGGLTKIRADSRNNEPSCSFFPACSASNDSTTVSGAAPHVTTIPSNNSTVAATKPQAFPVAQTLSLAHTHAQVGGDKLSSSINSTSTPVASTLVEEDGRNQAAAQIREQEHLAIPFPASSILSQRHRSNSPPPQLLDLNLSRESRGGLTQWPSLEARLSRLVRAHINSKSRRTVDVHTILLWARDLYVQLYGQPGSHRCRKRQPSPDRDSYYRCYNYNVYNYYGTDSHDDDEASGNNRRSKRSDVKRVVPPAALGSLRKSSTIPRTLVYLSDSALSVPYVRRASAPVGSETGSQGDSHSTDEAKTNKSAGLLYDNDEDLNAYHNDHPHHHPHKIEATRFKGHVFFDIVEEEEVEEEEDDDDDTGVFECDDLERVPSITEAMIVEFAAANRITLSA